MRESFAMVPEEAFCVECRTATPMLAVLCPYPLNENRLI